MQLLYFSILILKFFGLDFGTALIFSPLKSLSLGNEKFIGILTILFLRSLLNVYCPEFPPEDIKKRVFAVWSRNCQKGPLNLLNAKLTHSTRPFRIWPRYENLNSFCLTEETFPFQKPDVS